jgi:hypothetical protein
LGYTAKINQFQSKPDSHKVIKQSRNAKDEMNKNIQQNRESGAEDKTLVDGMKQTSISFSDGL